MKKNDNLSSSQKFKILFVCLGNICRSTMAESVMTYLVKDAGLEARFEIASAATSREELGNPPHYGTVNKLRQEGIPVIPHQATQMSKKDYVYYDLLIGMDSSNIRNMNRIVGGDSQRKIYKMLSFANSSADVADPWYTGNFEETFRDVMAGCKGLLEQIRRDHHF